MRLPQMIKLLLYGNHEDVNGQVLPLATYLREHVNDAVDELTTFRLKSMLKTGVILPPAGAAGVADLEADAVESNRVPNPFLNKKELKHIMGDGEDEYDVITERLVSLRKDYLAKAMNLSFQYFQIGSFMRKGHLGGV